MEANRDCYNRDCLEDIFGKFGNLFQDNGVAMNREGEENQVLVDRNNARHCSIKKGLIYTAIALGVMTIVIALMGSIGGNISNSARLQQLADERHVTYVRWGHLDCPHIPGTTRIYDGFAAAAFHTNVTGSVYQCLPANYRHIHYYNDTMSLYKNTSVTKIHGVEYVSFLPGRTNQEVPCALCKASMRSTVIMIPATERCNNSIPNDTSWTKEYSGYLMTNSDSSTFNCIDQDAQVLYKTDHDPRLEIFSHVATGNDPPHADEYDSLRVLSCVVCTI